MKEATYQKYGDVERQSTKGQFQDCINDHRYGQPKGGPQKACKTPRDVAEIEKKLDLAIAF